MNISVPSASIMLADQDPPIRRLGGVETKILMTVDAVGGVWRYAMELGAALRPLGYMTHFVGLGPEPSQAQRSEARAIGELTWLDEPLDWMVGDAAELRGVAPSIARVARRVEAELLHLNLPSQADGLEIDLPIVVAAHSCLATWWRAMRGTPLPPEWKWQREANRIGMHAADAVVAPSASFAGLLQQEYGTCGKLHVVHNGISSFLSDGAKQPFVFAAGRWWDEGKNAAILDAAAKTIQWPVRLAGALAHPAGGSIELRHAQALGALPYGDVIAEMRTAGIVVSPSLYEPFGLAALEGARAGAALVLADIPTYRELWHEAAIFFDPHDPQDLARAVNALSQDEAQRTEIGMRALARSRRYMPHLQARRFGEVYAAARDAVEARVAA